MSPHLNPLLASDGIPQPVFETTRGRIVESVHYGSIAVVDATGHIMSSLGDPHTVAFLRSSAKPFQALPFVEHGGVEHFGLTPPELSLACASHNGSALHLQTVQAMQEKIGITENQLRCGAHMPDDVAELKSMIVNDRKPTPNYNNCSGKHTAMLAHAKMRGLPLENYLDINHPIQQDILASFAEMCLIPVPEIELGTDGCSAPNFAIPLYNAALGMARFCDPHELTPARAEACKKITSAITSYPEMVSGYGEFDEQLMRAGVGKLITKRGAEGFQIVGVMPDMIYPNSPGIGIAFKVSDGDAARLADDLSVSNRVRPAVAIEILHQLGAIFSKQEQALATFGPVKSIQNYEGIVTGQSRPVFQLSFEL